MGVAGGRRGDGQGSFWGDLIGPNPTDRAKNGVKRSLLVEADGGPLSVVLAGANVRDDKLLRATLDAVVVERPSPTEEAPQHLCLDKGYDNRPTRKLVEEYDYVAHIRRIGEEKLDETKTKRYPARRWVVEMSQPQCPRTCSFFDPHGSRVAPPPTYSRSSKASVSPSRAVRSPASAGGYRGLPAGLAAV